MRCFVDAHRGRAENPRIAIIVMAAMVIPATARADVAPGPIEFSMFAFVWAVATLLLGGAIYLVVTRIRRDRRAIEHSNETPPPRVWKRPLFRRSVVAASVLAFMGLFAASCWMLEEGRRASEDLRMKMWMEQQERAASSVK